MLLFVLIFGAIVLAFFSVLAGALSLFFTRFFAKEPNRARKLTLAFCLPGFVLFSFSLTCGIGNAVVASLVGTDSGIGDWFYVDISRNYSLYFVDTTAYHGNIGSSGGGVPLIPDVIKICERENVLFGELADGKFFSFDIETEKPKIYAHKADLITAFPKAEQTECVPAGVFYARKAQQLHGAWLYIIPILSVALSTAAASVICRIVLRKRPATSPQS